MQPSKMQVGRVNGIDLIEPSVRHQNGIRQEQLSMRGRQVMPLNTRYPASSASSIGTCLDACRTFANLLVVQC